MPLMKTTNATLKEIADQAGFASIHHFTRVFKSETGETPGQYRKKHGMPA